ncbi:MAG: SBBP repeat-containing protein [Kiritimatiellae bacterium]|nr:SBBP repeat-containing protein [Kiritimatiellia bacterium]
MLSCRRFPPFCVLLTTPVLIGAAVFAEFPGRRWTRILGSGSDDGARGVAVDGDGYVYVAGPAGDAFGGQTNAGGSDACLLKFDAGGTRLWTRLWGSGSDDTPAGVCAGISNCLYVAGSTAGEFDGQPYAGSNDVFLTKLTPAGDREWSRIWGSAAPDYAYNICPAADGTRVYVVGATDGAFFGGTNAGSPDCFLTAFDANGDPQWSQIWGSDWDDSAYGVCVDPAGSVYVAGETFGSFHGQTNTGNSDLFLSKFDSSGNWQWSRIWGSFFFDYGRAVCVDESTNVYVLGGTSGAFDGQTNSGGEAFCLSRFTADGTREWSRIWALPPALFATTDGTNLLYAAGNDGVAYVEPFNDLILTACDVNGDLHWTSVWGSVASDLTFLGPCVALDSAGALYRAGETAGSFDGQTNAGAKDMCLSKYETDLQLDIANISQSNGVLELGWDGAWDRAFTVQTTTNLPDTNAWVDLTGYTNAAGAETMTCTNTAGTTAFRCYRVIAQ